MAGASNRRLSAGGSYDPHPGKGCSPERASGSPAQGPPCTSIKVRPPGAASGGHAGMPALCPVCPSAGSQRAAQSRMLTAKPVGGPEPDPSPSCHSPCPHGGDFQGCPSAFCKGPHGHRWKAQTAPGGGGDPALLAPLPAPFSSPCLPAPPVGKGGGGCGAPASGTGDPSRRPDTCHHSKQPGRLGGWHAATRHPVGLSVELD